MSILTTTVTLALVGVLGSLTACSGGSRGADSRASAPIDSSLDSTAMANTGTPADTGAAGDTGLPGDTLAPPAQPPATATPPITPPAESSLDTPPSAAAKPTAPAPAGGGLKVTKAEYDGWRQYSVNCARCHGQDVLPNPVAANLLVSLGPGGPIDSEQKFFPVVSEGRPDRGMPAFKGTLSPEQIRAIYAYVEGRAEKRIPPGRPSSPA